MPSFEETEKGFDLLIGMTPEELDKECEKILNSCKDIKSDDGCDDADDDEFYTWRLAIYWMKNGYILDGLNIVKNSWIAMKEELQL